MNDRLMSFRKEKWRNIEGFNVFYYLSELRISFFYGVLRVLPFFVLSQCN